MDLALHRRRSTRSRPRSARGSPRTSSCPPAFETLADEVEFGQRVAGEARGRPLGRHPLARRVRRPERDAGAGRDLQHGVRTVARAAAGQPRRHQPRRARRCSRTAPTSRRQRWLPRDPRRRRDLVPAVQRARRGLRPRVARDAGRCRVDDGWLLSGQKVWTSYAQFARWGICLGAHRSRRAEAQGISLPRRRHAGAGHRDAAARADHRRGRVQRGVLRRGVRARRPSRRRAAQRLGGRQHDARARAGHRVPVQGTGRARGVPRRAVRSSRPSADRLDDVEIADALAQSFVELRVLRLHNWRTLSRLAEGHRARARSRASPSCAWTDMTQHLVRHRRSPILGARRVPPGQVAAAVAVVEGGVDRRRHVGGAAHDHRRAHARTAARAEREVTRGAVPMKVTGIDHVVFRVADVERRSRSTSATLGLEPVRVDEWRAGEVLFPSVRIDATTIIDLFPRELAGDDADERHDRRSQRRPRVSRRRAVRPAGGRGLRHVRRRRWSGGAVRRAAARASGCTCATPTAT